MSPSGEAARKYETSRGEEWPLWKRQPPPEGSPGVGQWVWRHYEALKRHRDKQGLVELWNHFHNLYRGRIFKRRTKYSQVIANLFFKSINAMVANLTDNKPRASIMPHGDTPDEIADGLQAAYDRWWKQTQQQGCLQASVSRSERYGYQCDEMRFNPDLEGGTGNIETYRHDTFDVFFWPGHVNVQTQPGMCTQKAMELGEIYDLWPEAEGKVMADPDYSDNSQEQRLWTRATSSNMLRPESGGIGYANNYIIPGTGGLSGSQEGSGIKRALVVRFWVKDYTMQWVDPRTGETKDAVTGEKVSKNSTLYEQVIDETGQPVINPETGKPLLRQAKNPETGEPIVPEEWSKYPGYLRCITVTNKGNLVLADEPNPSINPALPRSVTSQCYLWDKFPFIKRFSYSDDIGEYGLSIMEQIETLVVEVCKKLTQYSSHLDILCRNPLLLPKGCGVSRNDVTNKSGRVWEPVSNLANQIRFLEVPPAPNDIITFIELCIRLADMVSGVTDVSEGRRPVGVTAASAIAALQEKAQTIYREKIRHNDLYLEEQGYMFISLCQNWFTEEQMLRYEGKYGDKTFPFRGIEAQGELSFNIEAGSTLPRSRAIQQQQTLDIARIRPNFPNKVLLKEMNIPNYDEVAAQMDSGPLNMALEKLKTTGLFDDQTLQSIQQILTMDDQSFRKSFGTGNPFVDMRGGINGGQSQAALPGTGRS